jgi:anthranilate/para-aminobenzoate synthase component I
VIVCSAPKITAAAAAERVAALGGAVWLKSPGDNNEAVSFVACGPVETIRTNDLTLLQSRWAHHRSLWATDAPRCPIAIGYFSYELGKGLVGGKYAPQSSSGWPELELRFFDAVFESRTDGTTRILAVDAAAAERLTGTLAAPSKTKASAGLLSSFFPAEPETTFLQGVQRVQEFLSAGDAYQVNLARRILAAVANAGMSAGLVLAQQLERDTPAPFGIWYGPDHTNQRALVGNSPELFLRTTVDGVIETSPIKGTRPRDLDPLTATRELANSKKDRAEHDMIVDLERNDLGRLCEIGTVTVVEHARVMTLPTVHHLVSTVRGQLRKNRPTLAEIFTATFPGGSITGAPKRRAMEIISELETCERGPYTGATGWFGAAGDMELAIAIRTAAITANQMVLWVGGGIVIDSDPATELAETNTKAQAFSRLWQSS